MGEIDYRYAGVLDCLNKHGVEYVLIGGLAANLLGSPIVTQDVDICYARDQGNLERLARALEAMDARLRGAPPDVPFLLDAKTLAAGDSFTFTTEFGSVDCLGTPSGTTRGYEELAPNAVTKDAGGILVRVSSLEDLMRMKRAAGRLKDRLMLEELGALRDRLEERGE